MKLQPITIEVPAKDGSNRTDKVELHCRHKAEWPPAHARLPDDALSLRQSGAIDEHKFQQLQTWQKVCGIFEMDPAKCSTCPHALVERKGHWVTFAPGGKPTTALPPFASAKEGRQNR